MSSQAHYNLKLESKFLNDKGEIDFSKIEARELPKADFNNTKEFKSKFTKTQGKYGYIQTPYKEIKVNIPYAYKHFYVNTNNVNRNYIKGAFFDTFANPLFIAKKQTDKGESVYFYNVYKDSDGNNLGIFGIGVDSNGNVDFKTLYKDNGNNRLKEMIGLDDGNIVYTNPSLALPNHNTIAGLSRPSTAMDSAATTSGKETDSSDSTTESVLLSKRNESEVSLAKAQAKFKYDEKKAKDLLEWHKDSHPLTKDSDGLPKVFYHGSNAKDLEEFKSEFDQSGLGFWFNADENRAKAFAKSSSDKLYPVFLYIKKPFDLNQSITTKNVKELSELLGEDLHKYIATDKQSLQKELDKATKSKDFAVIEGRGLMLESNKKISEYAYNYNGKWYVNLYNEADLQREGLEKLLPFMQKAQNLNQTKTITELLNEKEMGEYQKNTHTFLQKLKTKGYDSILPNGKAKNDDIIVFDSNQIKHINNKGSYTDSNGNITATKPKGVEAKHKYFNEGSPNIYQSNAHIGSGMLGGSVAGVESDENGNIIGFDPAKFALGFLGGAGGSVAVGKARKYAIMRKMSAKKNDKKLYETFKKIDTSPKFGAKMNLIGKENLNADVLAYALANNKRVAINKLDENIAKELGFKYPSDVRRTIQPSDVIHTLNRHGADSNLVQKSGQKAVTLETIAKYQEYADNADIKGFNLDSHKNNVLVSIKQLERNFYVVIEQIRKGQNELGYKNMYFENGELNEDKIQRLLKQRIPNT